MSLGDYLANQRDAWQAHPFQKIGGQLLGAFIPGGSLIADRIAQQYNNSQFNNAEQQSTDALAAQGDQAGNAAMGRPLNGPLGQAGSPPQGSGWNPNGGWNMGQNYSPATSNLMSFLGGQRNQPQGSAFQNPQLAPGSQFSQQYAQQPGQQFGGNFNMGSLFGSQGGQFGSQGGQQGSQQDSQQSGWNMGQQGGWSDQTGAEPTGGTDWTQKLFGHDHGDV